MTIVEKLTPVHGEHPGHWFSLFTRGGHVITGRILDLGETIALEAGKEVAEVPADRVEAFSHRPL